MRNIELRYYSIFFYNLFLQRFHSSQNLRILTYFQSVSTSSKTSLKMNPTPPIFTLLCWIFHLALVLNIHAQNTTNYSSSSLDFPNPERGFYYPTVTLDDGNMNPPPSSSWINSLRTEYTPFQANYQVHSTLLYRYFDLDNYKDASNPNNIIDIPQSYLDDMQAVFDNVRTGRAKIIVRFAYTRDGSDFDPPHGDASKAQVLRHIEQVTPVLRANADVILTVQMGFIGIWGENYYTDFFGDASQQGFLNSTNWSDRQAVIDALLAALPSNRTIQVRYPQQKQKAIFGVNAAIAPTQSTPLAANEAHQGTPKARIGFHNDCFLASNADFGTFTNYDQGGSSSDLQNLRNYKAADSQFVPVGGETCSANVSVDGDEDCAASGGRADTDLALFHYSFLNSDYNNTEVNNKWVGECMDDIKRRLGYRFELQNSSFPTTAQAGQRVHFQMNLNNVGYAAPFNPRGAELVLINTTTDEKWFAKLDSDPRFWSPENSPVAIDQNFCLPNSMPNGTYQLHLNLPDPQVSLYDIPEYSIRLANTLSNGTDVWDATTGYNNLGQTLTINNTASGDNCNGETEFSNESAVVLAIQTLDFTAVNTTTGQVRCEWKTAISDAFAKTYLQRSTDGTHFFF